jgi:ketosteroid isomerase-like protein
MTAQPTGTGTGAAVRAHIRAFNERDLAALTAGFTQDAHWVTGSTEVRGREQLAEFFGAAMTGLLPTLTVHELLVDGDRAACRMTESLTLDGVPRSFAIAGFFRLRDGLISSAKIYREGSAEV